jgi:hypothetical protein
MVRSCSLFKTSIVPIILSLQGQTLSYPGEPFPEIAMGINLFSSTATGKTSESGGNHRFLYSVSEMQGWRISVLFTTPFFLSFFVLTNRVFSSHGGCTYNHLGPR